MSAVTPPDVFTLHGKCLVKIKKERKKIITKLCTIYIYLVIYDMSNAFNVAASGIIIIYGNHRY